MNASYQLLTPCHDPCSELQELLDTVLARLAPYSELERARSPDKQRLYEDCVLAFLRLIAIVAMEGADGFRTPFDNQTLSALGFRSHAKDVREELEQAGLIEVSLGFQSGDPDRKGKVTLIRPTSAIRELVRQSGVRACDLIRAPHVTTVVKDGSNRNMPESVAVQDAIVRRYNEWTGQFCLHRPDGSTSVFIHLIRIFSGDWNSGGRLYCGFWIDMPRVERPSLLIGGEPTCELDFKCLHPRMLYARAGRDLDFDPYVVPGFDHVSRETGKKVFNTLINGKTGKLTYQSKVRPEFPTTVAMNAFAEAMIERLEPIKDHFGTEAWRSLQKDDSELAIKIMDRCMLQNIPVYPIHDGFLVRRKDQDKVRMIMIGVYRDKYGLEPIVNAK